MLCEPHLCGTAVIGLDFSHVRMNELVYDDVKGNDAADVET